MPVDVDAGMEARRVRRQLKKKTDEPTEAPTPKPSTRSPTIMIVEDSAAPSTSAPSTVYPTGFEKTTPPTPTALLAATSAPTPTEMFPIELRTNPPTPTMLFPPSLKTFAPSPTDMGSWEPTAAPTLPVVSGGDDEEKEEEDDDDDDDDDDGGNVVDTGGDGSPSLDPTWEPTWEPTISFQPTTSSPTGYPTDNASWVNKTGWIDDDYVGSSHNSIVSIGRFSINWTETDTIIVSVIFTFCFAATCFWLLCCMYVQPKALLERDGRALDPYIKNRHYTAVKTDEPEGASRYAGGQPVSAHASVLTSERSPLIAAAARKPAGGSTNTNRALLHALRKEPGAGGAFDDGDGESGSDLDGKSDFNI